MLESRLYVLVIMANETLLNKNEFVAGLWVRLHV